MCSSQPLQGDDTVDDSEIPNNHLGCIRPCKQWDIYHINWCTISEPSTVSKMMYFHRYMER